VVPLTEEEVEEDMEESLKDLLHRHPLSNSKFNNRMMDSVLQVPLLPADTEEVAPLVEEDMEVGQVRLEAEVMGDPQQEETPKEAQAVQERRFKSFTSKVWF
jgi:hypothetical protein